MHDVGAAREPRETPGEGESERKARHARGAGRVEVGLERAVTLQVGHADLVAARALAAHLREQVHLRAAHVERGDHVQDLQTSSR